MEGYLSFCEGMIAAFALYLARRTGARGALFAGLVCGVFVLGYWRNVGVALSLDKLVVFGGLGLSAIMIAMGARRGG